MGGGRGRGSRRAGREKEGGGQEKKVKVIQKAANMTEREREMERARERAREREREGGRERGRKRERE